MHVQKGLLGMRVQAVLKFLLCLINGLILAQDAHLDVCPDPGWLGASSCACSTRSAKAEGSGTFGIVALGLTRS